MKEKEEKAKNYLTILTIITLIITIAAVLTAIYSVNNLTTKVSGLATSTGTANLTIETISVINFTTNTISWGSGRVSVGQTNAQLTTLETENVTNGNWTLQTAGGLRLENIGNVNVSLNLSVGKTAAEFISGTNPGYEWNITSVEAESCLNATNTEPTDTNGYDEFATANTTSNQYCSNFQFKDTADLIRIDLNITVPQDSSTGSLTDTITATATVI